MCLILFAWKVQAAQPLLVLANRDEYFNRPTLPLHRWENSAIHAGKDLSAGGTWLGVHESGRWAAITNYRQPGGHNPDAPSRGLLTEHFLESELSPQDYLMRIKAEAQHYNGFNLLVGTRDQLLYFSNREGEIRELNSGIYGLSNHLLDSDWHKVASGKRLLADSLAEDADDHQLFQLMQDKQFAAPENLPATGVGENMELLLSPRFIYIPNAAYGTRTTTLVRFTENAVRMSELSYENGAPQGAPLSLGWEFS